MQLLFDGSDESGGVEGLGLVPGRVAHFDTGMGLPVPHIGWNTLEARRPSDLLVGVGGGERVYFVHSYRCGGGWGGLRWRAGGSGWQRRAAAGGRRALAAAQPIALGRRLPPTPTPRTHPTSCPP